MPDAGDGGPMAPRFLLLDDLGHLAGLQAAGADAQPLRAAAAHDSPHRHEVGHPAAGGDVVGMADPMAEGGTLPADIAALRHARSLVVTTGVPDEVVGCGIHL